MTPDMTVVAALRESAPGERRVALTPDAVTRLRGTGLDIVVEAGAGDAAKFPDDAYVSAGATVVGAEEAYARAGVVLVVRPPRTDAVASLRAGQVLIGLLEHLQQPELMRALAEREVTAVSLNGLPRTLPRAQTMDALTSQANVAGYKAVLIAADLYPRYFPLLMTAAGTSPPAAVLVLGAGVAGLQAIGTARRLGAVVRAYDVRPEAKAEIESVGATALELPAVDAPTGEGGYAPELRREQQRAQQNALADAVAQHDVVITTAQVPGRRPPLLVSAEAVKSMKPGSVVVDLAASPLGGNVADSQPSRTIVTEGGVTIVGAENLPSAVPTAASTAYARNLVALLGHLRHEGAFVIDTSDEIQAGVVITHGGRIVHPATAALADAAKTDARDADRPDTDRPDTDRPGTDPQGSPS